MWKLGIFEGLLLLLAAHAIIQFIFMKRLGKSNAEIWQQFKSSFQAQKQPTPIAQEDIVVEPSVPVLDKFQMTINNHNLDLLMKLYCDNAILTPAFSTKLRRGKAQIRKFYKDFFDMDDVHITIYQVNTQKINDLKVDNGMYAMRWKNKGFEKEEHIRFSLVIKDGKIVTDHSSVEPVYNETVNTLPKAYAGDFV